MNKSDCRGCNDDVYNGSLAVECWAFKNAAIVTRFEIGTWTLPTDKGAFREVQVPNCYRRKGVHFFERLPDFVRAEDVRRRA